jgi:hypothetical protein
VSTLSGRADMSAKHVGLRKVGLCTSSQRNEQLNAGSENKPDSLLLSNSRYCSTTWREGMHSGSSPHKHGMWKVSNSRPYANSSTALLHTEAISNKIKCIESDGLRLMLAAAPLLMVYAAVMDWQVDLVDLTAGLAGPTGPLHCPHQCICQNNEK